MTSRRTEKAARKCALMKRDALGRLWARKHGITMHRWIEGTLQDMPAQVRYVITVMSDCPCMASSSHTRNFHQHPAAYYYGLLLFDTPFMHALSCIMYSSEGCLRCNNNNSIPVLWDASWMMDQSYKRGVDNNASVFEAYLEIKRENMYLGY